MTLGATAVRCCSEPPAARGDTIYMTVADKDGNVVSLIQSIYESFGAGIVAGETGITLHNRGGLFTLETRSTERARARQAALPHAVPAWCRTPSALAVIGVMGGDMQAQGHVQVLAQPDRLRNECSGGR